MNSPSALSDSEQHLLTLLTKTSRLLLACLILQSPFVLFLLMRGEPQAIANLTIHTLLVIRVLTLCTRKQFYRARTLLLSGFMSFVVLAAIIWQQPLGIPYFLLLGAVTCAFFFRRREMWLQRSWAMAFALAFVLLNLTITSAGSQLNQAIHISNTVTLAFASLLILLTLEMQNKRRWLHMLASQKRLNERLSHLLPPLIHKKQAAMMSGQTSPIDCCAVLFADMAGFKRLTNQLDDEEIVYILNALYQRFDERASLMGICRIKTNGDEYMAALSDAFHERQLSPQDTAQEMLQFARAINRDFTQVTQECGVCVTLRIGIAMGPVRAGIIGRQRPAFDIWGRTVNLASVLEQISTPQRITVCPFLYFHLLPSDIKPVVCSVSLPDGPGYALQLAESEN